MYYAIVKKPNTYPPEFLQFSVPKFITKKENDTVIFEFNIKGKKVRKWVPKSSVLLLTDNEDFYQKTLQNLTKVKKEQELLVEEAKQKLNTTIDRYAQTMNKEFEEFEALREKGEIPCILKNV